MNFDLGPDLRTRVSPSDHDVLNHVLSLEPEGWALEFGVGSGWTLGFIAATMPVIGFDSFQGLPEDWRPDFKKGMFAQSKIPEIEGATIVTGWFEETLPTFDWPDRVGLVHMDADLYSSTITVLAHIAHLLNPGTYIVFDEFFGYEGAEQHEQRAWAEFVGVHNINYEVIGHGREQWAIRIS